jgi:very-short-patch-repair endonuclease
LADLDAAGLSAGGVQSALRSGRIVRIRHGVYTTEQVVLELADDQWGQHALRVRGALAMAGDTAAAAGASAAALHGLDMLGQPPRRPILVRPVEVSDNGRRTAATSIRVARLPESHLTKKLGWPSTGVARTLADIARRQGERTAVVAGDCALRGGLETQELGRVLLDCQRAPGIRTAREALELCDGRAESPLESIVRLALFRGGVPQPELQFVIGPYRVDFCWPWAMVVLEADGQLKYQTAGDLLREKQREDWIRAQGYLVLRTEWAEAFSGSALLCRRVAQALAAQPVLRRGGDATNGRLIA